MLSKTSSTSITRKYLLNQELISVRSVESVRISVHSNSLSASFSREWLGRSKEKNEKLLILFFTVLSIDLTLVP
jgi:hypothetical protein